MVSNDYHTFLLSFSWVRGDSIFKFDLGAAKRSEKIWKKKNVEILKMRSLYLFFF